MKENLLCAFCAKSFRPRRILRFFAERKLKEKFSGSQLMDTVIASGRKSSNGHPSCEDLTESHSMNTVIARVASAYRGNPVKYNAESVNLKSSHGFRKTFLDCFVTVVSLAMTGVQPMKKAAFSLVEMLMALLVASLLLAALAPVMTKRMDEAKINISGVGAAQYDKDAIIQIFTGAEGEDKIFNVPSDVNMLKFTLMGGGGAGGNAFFGKEEVTTTKEWTVPDGVTKLRVFMVGGGGGGASGGLGSGTAYGDIPATTASETCKDFLGAGDKGSMAIPSNASWIAPALNDACKASGETKWTLVSNPTITYEPGKEAGAELKVTACGGGGGGGGGYSVSEGRLGGGGGSGGYVKNVSVISPVSNIYIRVGGGGGGGGNGTVTGLNGEYGAGGGGGGAYADNTSKAGGNGGTYGGNGSSGLGSTNTGNTSLASNGSGTILSNRGNAGATTSYNYAGYGGQGGVWGGGGGGGGRCFTSTTWNIGAGGGGGGATTISASSGNDESKIIFQIGGGGGGGGSAHKTDNNTAGGGGGGGGGYGAGGGGGGAGSYASGAVSSGGKYIGSCLGSGNGYGGLAGSQGFAGGGGGGYGGASGATAGSVTAGTISNIFGSSYCNGGDGAAPSGSATRGSNGKPGAIRICYGTSQKRENALKCEFSLPANGSGGGGAGQITVGEITVTPKETLVFTIGRGGVSRTVAGKNGDPGVATTITRKSSGEVLARAEGGLAGQYSASATVESAGGGKRSVQIIDNNWLGINYDTTAGTKGSLATAILNKGYGGAGGSSMNMKGEILQGGQGGNTAKNGASPLNTSYGAGGGGGSGSQSEGDSTFGIGAGGAAGFIYFEYGGSNGGGGTVGEYIQKIVNVKPGTEVKIDVGAGGESMSGDGNGKKTTVTYEGGGSTKTLSARGGIRGNDGLVKDVHGDVQKLPNTYSNYKSDDAASVNGQAGTPTYGGIGGYMEYIYKNTDETDATYIKAKDGTIAGPILGGCGGNLTTLMAGITCNDAANTPNGKNGTFGGGGGGGAVINEVGGIGGMGGKGVVIIEYKGVGL